jgi:hypothetical protein
MWSSNPDLARLQMVARMVDPRGICGELLENPEFLSLGDVVDISLLVWFLDLAAM